MATERSAADLLHPLDLLAPDELQAVQDSLVAVTGLYVSLSTPVGQPLTRAAPLPPVCALLQPGACREPALLCGFASGRWRRALAEGRIVYARCPHCALQLAAVPLRVRGRLLATLVCGRVLAASVGQEQLPEWAASLCVDESALRLALEAMPIIDEARFRGLVGHARVAVEGLARLAEARLDARQARQALELANRRLGSLGAIAAGIIRSTAWRESLGQALQTILDVLRLDSGAVFVRGEEGQPIRLVAHRGVSPEFVALGHGELRDVIISPLEGGETWVVRDVATEPGLPGDILRRLQFGAFVAVPLRAAQEVLGVLTVHADRPRALRPDEVALIAAAGEQLAVGLQGLQLLAAEKRRAGELAVLNEVAVAVGHSLDLKVIVEQALGTAVKSLRAGAGLIYLQEEGAEAPVLAAQHGLSAEAEACWRERPPVGWEPGQGLDSRVRWGANVAAACSQRTLVLGEGLASYASVPLRGQRRILGLLVVFTREPREFLANEIELLQAVAHQIGLAVENAELYGEAQRRLTELEALQHFNERILHTMREGIFIVSLRGRISYATPRLAALTGYGVDELIGSDWLALAGPEERDVLRQALQTALSGRTMRAEFDLLGKDGASRRVSLGAVPLSDGGVVTGMLGVASDLSGEVQLRRRLRQAEKLSAIGELVSGVAHELNNPLTVIRGYAQLLQGMGECATAGRELAAIAEHAERAARIVQELLTFARERPPARDVVDLNAVLQSALDMRERPLAAAGIGVRRELAAGLPQLRGDPYQLQQVFLNILINAEQALAEVGHEGWITVSTGLTEGSSVLACVRDNGPGIAAAVADRIFDPFFTTKADRQGTGLGLSICYGIVHAHGGRIWAESVPGEGAVFYVSLPVLTDEPLPELTTEPEPVASGQKHVLVLEDEVDIAHLLARYIERLGHRVTVAHEASAALEAVAQASPDLLLTDLKMPGMNGREFYAALCDSRPELARRVVFVTGDIVSPDTQSFLRQTGRPHLAKPFSLDEVRSLVEQMQGSGCPGSPAKDSGQGGLHTGRDGTVAGD